LLIIFKLLALEHPCRDIVYHLLSSCDPTDLEAGGEKFLVEFYVQQLNDCLAKKLGKPIEVGNDQANKLTTEEAWEQYRLHSVWVLVAFVICAGAGDHYFTDSMAKLTLTRIIKGCDRLDTLSALKLLLARNSRRSSFSSPPQKQIFDDDDEKDKKRIFSARRYSDQRRVGGSNFPHLSP